MRLILKNKKHDIRPYSTNPVFQFPIDEKCKFCIYRGRKKHFKTLWRLYEHFSYHHPNEAWQKIIQDLVEKIIQGDKV